MNEWITFDYREFYDIPRMLILTFQGRVLLLQASFNEEKDEYSDQYTVYELPTSAKEQLEGSWEDFAGQAISYLGEIPVKEVNFDPTRRRQMDTGILSRILSV